MADKKTDAEEKEVVIEDATDDKSEDKVEVVTEEEVEVEEADTEESEEETDKSEDKKDKAFFKKKKDKKDEMIEELNDKYKRLVAEFDNFRKRTDKEKSTMYEYGAKDIISKMLPVIDNFERGLATIPEEDKESPFAEGMDKIYKQLTGAFEELGVKVIETEGHEFDPELHNAVMHVEDESLGENVIAEEFQKGYTYKESVVRHSMVKVAN